MNNAARKQFLEIVQKFKLATEANKEALASALMEQNNQEASQKKVLTPVLAFCMERANSPHQAEAMFDFVLQKSPCAYWPTPVLPERLRADVTLKGLCLKHCIIPVQYQGLSITLCGTNPYDQESMMELLGQIGAEDGRPPYGVFCLSEPKKIIQALTITAFQ